MVAIAAARRVAFFRRRPRRAPRHRLAVSDSLLERVERCRLAAEPLIPGSLFAEVVQLVASVDPVLPRQLGTNRRPDHVAAVLFETQARLMRAARTARPQRPAEIIQLFPG